MRIESLWQDVKYAVRGIRSKPGFAIAVVLTIGLGIGANAAMFGITDRLLFRPPSFMKDPNRVHRVYLVRTFDGKENYGSHFQYTRFKDLTRWTRSFDVTAATSESDVAVGTGEAAREMRIGAVSATYWSLFDVRPEIGRFFTVAEDTTPVGAPVTVLSYAFWHSRYGGRVDVLGRRVKIGNVDYSIIGVAPPNFVGTSPDRVPVAWVPITTYAGTEFTARVAFGAQVKDVVRLVLGEGLRVTIAGILIGAAVALYAGKWVAPLLFNVKPTDPLVFGFVVVVLLVAATLASIVPAMRAARVDPNVALRSE